MVRTRLRFLAVLSLVALALGLTGCGGKSSTDVDDPAPGDSDANNDGSVSSDAASTSDSSSGDTSASDDSSGSDSSSDGSSGSDSSGSDSSGSDSSGSDSSSSADSGGSSAQTSGGMGGTTGSTTSPNPVPPMDLVEGCARACAAETASGCASAASAADCAGSCIVITRVTTCNGVVREFYECVDDNAATSCSDEGDVVFNACVSEQLAAYACIFRDAPDDDLAEPCQDLCTAQADAECALTEDLAGCVIGCQSIPTIVPSCEAGWTDFLACSEQEEVTCDAAGEPTVEGCAAEFLQFLACAYPEVGE